MNPLNNQEQPQNNYNEKSLLPSSNPNKFDLDSGLQAHFPDFQKQAVFSGK